MDRAEFQERLLQVMERKIHWAWPAFSEGLVPKDRLHVHLEQEYAVYVRDFPVLIGRAYVQCDVPEVRRELVAQHGERPVGRRNADRVPDPSGENGRRDSGLRVDRAARRREEPAP